jgi:hypothetical protein
MRKAWCLPAAAGLLLGATGLLHAGGQPDPRAVIAKAVKAQGGAKALDKFQSVTIKLKGKSYAASAEGIPFTAEFSVQGAEQMRIELEFSANGMDFKFVQVVNRDKGWRVIPGMDKTVALTKEQLKEQRGQMYAGWVASLQPLLREKGAKALKLSPVGEAQVGDRPAVGVRVEREGERPVNLFFDKKSGLLVKSEFTIKDEAAGDKEVMQETLYKDYKTVGGARHPTRLIVNHDGKRHTEAEVTEFERHEQLDDSVFAKP